jgi:hypothetical protein
MKRVFVSIDTQKELMRRYRHSSEGMFETNSIFLEYPTPQEVEKFREDPLGFLADFGKNVTGLDQ